jgi:hypothetical protein
MQLGEFFEKNVVELENMKKHIISGNVVTIHGHKDKYNLLVERVVDKKVVIVIYDLHIDAGFVFYPTTSCLKENKDITFLTAMEKSKRMENMYMPIYNWHGFSPCIDAIYETREMENIFKEVCEKIDQGLISPAWERKGWDHATDNQL